jgi:hypothetical protein
MSPPARLKPEIGDGIFPSSPNLRHFNFRFPITASLASGLRASFQRDSGSGLGGGGPRGLRGAPSPYSWTLCPGISRTPHSRCPDVGVSRLAGSTCWDPCAWSGAPGPRADAPQALPRQLRQIDPRARPVTSNPAVARGSIESSSLSCRAAHRALRKHRLFAPGSRTGWLGSSLGRLWGPLNVLRIPCHPPATEFKGHN